MNLDDLRNELSRLHEQIDAGIEGVTAASVAAQAAILEATLKSIDGFELANGRFVSTQSYAQRLAALERRFTGILGHLYAPSVREYLTTYKTIEDATVAMQQGYNDLKLDIDALSPIRKAIYNQASYYLTDGLASAYIQPAKFILMQQVTGGASINETRDLLQQWHDNGLPTELASGRQTPNLQRYATQIARDSVFKYQGAINEKIAQDFDLKHFVYVGGVVKDSRPLCRHLVGLQRIISLDEMPKLIKLYPEGLYPDTSRKNFIANRGGYACRHGAMPVRND